MMLIHFMYARAGLVCVCVRVWKSLSLCRLLRQNGSRCYSAMYAWCIRLSGYGTISLFCSISVFFLLDWHICCFVWVRFYPPCEAIHVRFTHSSVTSYKMSYTEHPEFFVCIHALESFPWQCCQTEKGRKN